MVRWRTLPRSPHWLAGRVTLDDPYSYAIVDRSGQALGIATLMEIRPAMGVIEVGHIALFAGPAAHAARNRGAVPARALRVRDARLSPLRMEVQRAQRAVAAGGAALWFRVRGVLRQHMIAKGRNRDTAYFSMLDSEWPARKAAFERWLAPENFDADGRQMASLSELNGAQPLVPPSIGANDVHILITGAAGMIGRKLTERLAKDGGLNGQPIDRLTLLDVVTPATAGALCRAGRDRSPPTWRRRAKRRRRSRAGPTSIFHLAGVVSGEAELDFDKGYRVNLDGTRALLEAIRATGDGYRPRLVYTSSIAVFGAPFPESIPDDFHLTPLTSYGAQKAIGEALLADYTRRGFCDGVGIRLPSIVVRPGKPNKAASGFFSGIIREPLAGVEAQLPVSEAVVHTHASPRAAIGFLMHAAGLARDALGPRINLSMPGVCCTVAEQIASLRRIAGERVAARIRREHDPLVARIVDGWPQRIEARRARELGFKAESSFDEIVRIHIDEDRGGTFVD